MSLDKNWAITGPPWNPDPFISSNKGFKFDETDRESLASTSANKSSISVEFFLLVSFVALFSFSIWAINLSASYKKFINLSFLNVSQNSNWAEL